MQVITLYPQDFNESCKQLANLVQNDYNPDLIIGVLTGGGYVGRQVKSYFPAAQYTELKVQRRSTSKKEKGVANYLLTHLPMFVLDKLRMLESFILEKKANFIKPKRDGIVKLPQDIETYLEKGIHKILLVDDAIDTGATLHLINRFIIDHHPTAEVRLAVITVTMKHSMAMADYFLYNDRTLIRFPWSKDIKK